MNRVVDFILIQLQFIKFLTLAAWVMAQGYYFILYAETPLDIFNYAVPARAVVILNMALSLYAAAIFFRLSTFTEKVKGGEATLKEVVD